jgi:hypothetical protein
MWYLISKIHNNSSKTNMEGWRGSSKDSVGLLIIACMLSLWMVVVVLLMMMSYNSGIDKPSDRNKKEKTGIGVLKLWKKRADGKRAPNYKNKITITKLDNVNEQTEYGDIGNSSKRQH